MIASRKTRLFSALAALAVAFTMVTVDAADARRGGSFGSRGARTEQSVPSTSTAPSAAPVQRTMTQPGTAASSTAAGAASSFNRPSFGGSLMRGLMIGGLVGLLFGAGFGGFSGMLGLLVQALLIAGIVWLAVRFFRSRSQAQRPAMAGGPQPMHRSAQDDGRQQTGGLMSGIPGIGSRLGGGGASRNPATRDEIGIGQQDLDVFERRLAELQDAYSREDYGTLRRITTPEMMGHLSEELGQNASNGLRNEVSNVQLLQGDVAESWREAGGDYATVAMRYSSQDVTRERSTGRVVSGDERSTESTEIWTFVRERGGEWKLSAIQEA